MIKTTILLPLLVVLAIAAPTGAKAQYAATQDSTLRGVRRVYLNFTDVGAVLGPELANKISQDAALELRKTGIKVAKVPAELDMSQDAILNVSTIFDSRTPNLVLRMDVEQRAQVARTQQILQMVTWYHESAVSNYSPKKAAPSLVSEGVNKFLASWLDQNGR